MPAPVLLFDVMDTLVYDPFRREIPEFFGATLTELLAQKHPTAWLEFERGEISEQEYFRKMFRDGRPIDGEAFRSHVARAYRFTEGTEALLGELSDAGLEMHALSNYPEWYQLIESRCRLSRFLEWSFVSCATGVRKPDAEAYLGAARAVGREPAQCLFIDDRETNCAAARELGMPAICYESTPQLRAELAERGVLGG